MKKLFIFVLAFVAAFALVGCGGSGNGNGDKPVNPDTPTGDVVIGESNYTVETIENLNNELDDSVEVSFRIPFGTNIQNVIREFADKFEVEYPSVKITLDVVSGYDEMRKANIQDISSNTAPTMTVGYPDHFAEYLINKAIITLDNFIKDENVGYTEDELDDFLSGYITENRQFDKKGSYVGLPFNKSTEVMYYNADFFKQFNLEVPTTWDEVEIVGNKIMEIVKTLNDGQYPFMGNIKTNLKDNKFIPFMYDSGGNLVTTTSHQFGGEYTESIYKSNGLVDVQRGNIKVHTSAESIGGIERLQGLANAGLFNVPDKMGLTHGSGALCQGQNIMNVGSTGGSSYYSDSIGNIAVAPIPYQDAEHKYVIQQGTNVCIMAQASDMQKLAAWLFIKYMLTPENTAEFAVRTGYMPVRSSAYDLPVYTEFLGGITLAAKVHQATARYAKEGWNYFVDAAWAGSAQVRKECETAMATILCDGADIETALQDAINRIG